MKIKHFITYKQPREAAPGVVVYRTHFVSSDEQHFVVSERICSQLRDAQIFRCNESGSITDYESMIVSCRDTEQCLREFSCWNAFVS